MKKATIAAILALASIAARADSVSDYVQFEAGIGASHIADMGDGVWIQRGALNNKEQQNGPAFMAGLTGPVYTRGPWSVRWHADYVYMGGYSASVDGVPDAQYDAVKHKMTDYQPGQRMDVFNGDGHEQGVPLTLDAGYTWHGYRFGVEGGAWVYWQTWHESLYAADNNWYSGSHKTVAQVGYVVGARVERGNFGISYRYYQIQQQWNPFPGLATGAHVLMATYKF